MADSGIAMGVEVMERAWSGRIAVLQARLSALDLQLREKCATAEGYKLAFEEAIRLVAELTDKKKGTNRG